MTKESPRLLDLINNPDDLKKFAIKDLVQISAELRQFIIESVACNPGHFGASLGVVELTVALHYVLNTPHDKLVWDVGHQAYGHKILTGRRENFHTNRKYGGISGFPKVSESQYDSFGVGHASTSISAALGMAVAERDNKEKRRIVAVIGDGSMTGGLAFEGLNNAGMEKSNLLVILNDNNMAIDANVGALKDYLLDIATSKTYNKVKNDVWRFLGSISQFGPNAQRMVQKIDNSLKSIILRHSNLFESLNFRYFGPVDGHDVVLLARVLKDLGDIDGPKLLHVKTTKGKGFQQAEKDQTLWHHAPGKFDKQTGELYISGDKTPQPPKYQDVFGKTIVELAKQNDKIMGITPAMPTGCSLNLMMEEMPDRAFDVGIAEAHAVTFSAGLAIQGKIPFCNIYSTFMQRAFDQVIHDVALQNLNVIFCLDRGGLVGADGATHHGVFDLAYMRMIPNMIVSAPMNEEELRNLMFTAQFGKGPFSIRYPRGNGVMADWEKPFTEIEIGKGRLVSKGKEIAVLSIGHIGNIVQNAVRKLEKQNIFPAHYDMRFVKPIDEEILHHVCNNFQKIVCVEDGVISGGFGSAVLEFMAENNYRNQIKLLGVPDKFIDHGTQFELRKECGFDTEGILKTIEEIACKQIRVEKKAAG
ncbi:MAG: 1-deoxy-D-xylulose-5-phosphate synthase [Bacteroidales bacterium]|nr:1-deoxy-D-xylulose-5-phosphate synthase [Bacteroidales bacterium]